MFQPKEPRRRKGRGIGKRASKKEGQSPLSPTTEHRTSALKRRGTISGGRATKQPGAKWCRSSLKHVRGRVEGEPAANPIPRRKLERGADRGPATEGAQKGHLAQRTA
eukprot:3095674-Heterocapsa_arctica.AAC.1